jgi:peptidoglycan/LPS O-acetylase OafA/YrhL
MTNDAADEISFSNTTTITKKKKTAHPSSAATTTVATNVVDIEDQWVPVEGWSIADRAQEEGSGIPLLTSLKCYRGLVTFFKTAYGEPNDNTLAMVTESSSHLAGLQALYGQPWVWAGGGLGNMDECPLQVCLAGGTGRDSLTFASACVVGDCTASDLLSPDFVERLETASFRADHPTNAHDNDDRNVVELVHEYVTLHRRIAEVGKFLGTGWVCGDYKVDWELGPSVLWLACMTICFLLSFIGTFGRRRTGSSSSSKKSSVAQDEAMDRLELSPFLDAHKEQEIDGSNLVTQELAATSNQQSKPTWSSQFWSAWNMGAHCRRLIDSRPETSSLDGLKVVSILWIIAAHVMAIQSSTGAGYLNPKDFLPPMGVTTTVFGQLLFSSRYAVDTFLCISGYLAVHVLQRKLKNQSTKMTTMEVMVVLALRILRIMPLYITCLGFWMFLAPHFGSGGPFWYQWEHFLQPCRESWWTNLMFVNNFLPWGVSTTANCFYHSWYLAVDVQLFFLFAPWLTLLFHRSNSAARNVTIVLWTSSVVVTAVLSYTQEWSVNTFDGAAVAVFDVEGYAKPHVRAQSYLAGILVAMWPRRRRRKEDSDQLCRSVSSECDNNHRYPILFRSNKGTEKTPTLHSQSIRTASLIWWLVTSDTSLMALSLGGLAVLSFVTVTGAYVRRACTFEESPAANNCGSIWSPMSTFLYTAFSRAIWSICIAIIIHLCVEERGDLMTDDSSMRVNGTYSTSDDRSSSTGCNHDTIKIDVPNREGDQRGSSSSSTTITSATITSTTISSKPPTLQRKKKSILVLIVRSILSCNVFTPLAHLSFGAYLIHPIIIFIWTLGGREKVTFRLLTFMMDYCSTTVVTFFLSFVAAMVVEFPFGVLLRPPPRSQQQRHQQQRMPQAGTSTMNCGMVHDTATKAIVMHRGTLTTSPLSMSGGEGEGESLWDVDPSTPYYGAVGISTQ